jgi:hypothetical protein
MDELTGSVSGDCPAQVWASDEPRDKLVVNPDGCLMVPTVTMDRLISRYGAPYMGGWIGNQYLVFDLGLKDYMEYDQVSEVET